jgi:hypothetical protein
MEREMDRSPRDSDPAAYAACVMRVTASIEATGKLPYQHGVAWRGSSWACLPCWCGACCMWSTLWRVAACPFMCACKGPGYACSNNSCTECTDACMSDYVNAIGMRESVRTATQADACPQLIDAIAALEDIFRGVTSFTETHIALMLCVVGPLTWVPGTAHSGRVLPSLAMERLAATRARLIAQSDHGIQGE